MPQPPSADILSLMSESVSDMINGPPSDPDAQATVNDFLDYTEYLPSDLIRSLTLIGDLDRRYKQSAENVHRLTKDYGTLPTCSSTTDHNPTALREAISHHLIHATNAREAAYAEASRLFDVVDRHYNRLGSIIAKLEALPKPPSRDPTPVPQPSPQNLRSRSAKKGDRDSLNHPRITLRLDGARSTIKSSASGSRHKKRNRKITIPGEVLPPPNPNSPLESSASDWSSEPPSPIPIPTSRVGSSRSRNRGNSIRIPKISRPPKSVRMPKLKLPKPPRRPRPPGVMGTNVHSSVAGISTANALSLLEPPPENAVIGSADAPWLKLTPWEMAKLRKRMKKNAVWSPSETMIRRELSQLGRGPDNYHAARTKALENGEDFDHIDESKEAADTQTLAEGEIGISSLETSNRGMKLNEAKKLKKEQVAKELAAVGGEQPQSVAANKAVPSSSDLSKSLEAKSRAAAAAEDAERAARALALTSSALKNIFAQPSPLETPSKPKSESSRASRKRKRSTVAPQHDENASQISQPSQISPSSSTATVDAKKRKLSLNVLAANATTSSARPTPTTLPPSALSSKVSPPNIQSPPVPVPVPAAQSSPTKPANDTKKIVSQPKRPVKPPPPAINSKLASRPRSQGTPNTPVPVPDHTPDPVTLTTAGKDRPRRASTVPAPPAEPVIEPTVRQTRSKRPAPGPVNKSEEGATKTSVGKRKAAPKKANSNSKRSSLGEESTAADEVDPDEPRYCICGDVSWGHMIACENKDCENEWFHMKCVGFPPTRSKWYCPDCCKKLGVGERGQLATTRVLRRSS